jgi:hypothetical protein
MSLLAALLTATMAPLPVEGELPSLGGASGWLNSQPLTQDSLRGKVVLVDFWTYTSERVIQQLLGEAGISGIGDQLAAVDARGLEAEADWADLKSPENYLGHERTQNFASPGGAVLDKRRVYAAPAKVKLNDWALSGDWMVKKDSVVLNKANGRIAYRFHARDLHLVMAPAVRGASVRFRVLIDGQPPGAAHGIDVDDQGNGTVGEQRLYQLIRQPKPIADRQFEIEFLDPGVEAFAFTFG